jgi:peptide-methionine (S)-S-oxide reductase
MVPRRPIDGITCRLVYDVTLGGTRVRHIVMAFVALAAAVDGTSPQAASPATATFAGGCFWCMEGPFESIPGVLSVTSGYTGGQKKNPSYEEVSSGTTGHAESVQIVYDAAKVGYQQLLDVFWHNVDPLTANAQFCDHGTQYRSAIFFHDEDQRRAAEASKQKVEARFPGKNVVTQIVAASTFYPAEEYHQDFYKKSPARYQSYRSGCGRDRRLRELWGDEGGHR